MKPMKTPYPTAWILIGSLAAVLVLGFWLLGRGPARGPVPPPPTSPPTRAATSTPSPELVRQTPFSRGHRLAGTVVGDVRYAVIEAPDGRSDLYGIGETVPGLGRLVDVEADRATFEGDEGRIEIRLAPAPTPTSTPRRPAPTTDATLPPTPDRASGRKPSSKPSSADLDRSAS